MPLAIVYVTKFKGKVWLLGAPDATPPVALCMKPHLARFV